MPVGKFFRYWWLIELFLLDAWTFFLAPGTVNSYQQSKLLRQKFVFTAFLSVRYR